MILESQFFLSQKNRLFENRQNSHLYFPVFNLQYDGADTAHNSQSWSHYSMYT